MTSFAVSPIGLAATFESSGFVPARLGISAVKVTSSFPAATMTGSYGAGSAVAQIRLDRLKARDAMVTPQGQPTSQFQRFYQSNVESTEAALRALGEGQNNLSALVQGLLEAQAAASQAQSVAQAAQDQADQQAALQRVRDSYSDDNVLSASNVSGSVTITIAAHQRHYLDPIEAVALDGGAITGLAAATTYFVFYDDETLSGGAVTYLASMDEALATSSLDTPYRHKIGSIVTPTNPGGGSTGGSGQPPWKLSGPVNIA